MSSNSLLLEPILPDFDQEQTKKVIDKENSAKPVVKSAVPVVSQNEKKKKMKGRKRRLGNENIIGV